MFLIAGLGNPEEKYAGTRHNIGFMALDEFVAAHEFPDFSFDKYSNSLCTKGAVANKEIIFAKPQTFMNSSGNAIKNLCTKYKIQHTPKESKVPTGQARYIIVVHDDIDLPLGTLRIVQRGSSAGHKGVQSIIDHLGTNEFCRVRIGILPEQGKPKDVENFVLKKFAKDEQEKISSAIQHASAAIDTIISEGVEQAMNQYNKQADGNSAS